MAEKLECTHHGKEQNYIFNNYYKLSPGISVRLKSMGSQGQSSKGSLPNLKPKRMLKRLEGILQLHVVHIPEPEVEAGNFPKWICQT